MRRLIMSLGLLTACTQAPGVSVSAVSPLRDITAPVASQVDVTSTRLSGDWVVVRGFANAPAGPAAGARLSLTPVGADRMLLRGDGFQTTLTAAGPGRWAADGAGWMPSGPVWVYWLDADNRTAVIGRPDGAAAWIMDRSSSHNADRVAAGRDILTWFGYDVDRLEEVPE